MEEVKNTLNMTEEELNKFRNSFDPDTLGNIEIEGTDEDIPAPRLLKATTGDIAINKYHTVTNFTDASRVKGKIKFIVIHYVGATGGAYSNCVFFHKIYRGGSAHFFVGFGGEKWECVSPEDIAWHCGGKLQGPNGHTYHKICTNSNSIGIEMCVRNEGDKGSTSRDWHFEEATIEGTIELTKYLMNKYDIPVENVIRHFDVTGKFCPNPYINDTKEWNKFRSRLSVTKDSDQNIVQKASGIGDDAINYMLRYKYSTGLFREIAEAISNKEHTARFKDIPLDVYVASQVLNLIGLEGATIDYLKAYTWGDHLVIKLAKAML